MGSLACQDPHGEAGGWWACDRRVWAESLCNRARGALNVRFECIAWIHESVGALCGEFNDLSQRSSGLITKLTKL